MQTLEQKIRELEEKLKSLERHNRFVESHLIESEGKASILDKLIDLAKEEYLIQVRKTSHPINPIYQKRKKAINYLC
ncbi:TPA: hypothetical protein ACWX1I_003724 [Elizabethkingia anophelis]